MKTSPTKITSLKMIATGLLSGSLALVGCDAASRAGRRMAGLAVSAPLARSAGGDHATNDTFLRPLEMPRPSEQVLSAISSLPKDDAIFFVAPDRKIEIELVYRVIASLSWPREVGALHCGLSEKEGGRREILFRPRAEKKVRWLLLFKMPPPAGSKVKTEIGPHLKLVPVEETKEWTSYCSQ